MPAHSSIAKVRQGTPYRRLATNGGEKCGLGATVVEKMERWTVMEAPSKHRFCIINARRAGFDEQANVWE